MECNSGFKGLIYAQSVGFALRQLGVASYADENRRVITATTCTKQQHEQKPGSTEHHVSTLE